MPDLDNLTLTIRLHDPKEKKDAGKSAIWITASVPRSNLTLSDQEFIARHIQPAVAKFKDVHAR